MAMKVQGGQMVPVKTTDLVNAIKEMNKAKADLNAISEATYRLNKAALAAAQSMQNFKAANPGQEYPGVANVVWGFEEIARGSNKIADMVREDLLMLNITNSKLNAIK